MKHFILLFVIFFSLQSFSQNSIEFDISPKKYKKILKKLDLKITNRGYDGTDKIYIYHPNNPKSTITNLWNTAFFEMNIPTGSITEQTEDSTIIDANWILEISSGSYAFKILDLYNDKKVVATISTKEGMNIYRSETNRGDEYKMMVKVMMNELLGTIK